MEKELSNKKYKRLYTAFALLKNEKEQQAFLRDLCTMKELKEMANRMEAVFLLSQKVPYRIIARQTGLSTATVTRISHWFHHGEGGYKLILKRSKA